MAMKGLERKLRYGLAAINKVKKNYPALCGGYMGYDVIVALCDELGCCAEEALYYKNALAKGVSQATWFYIPEEYYQRLVGRVACA